MSRPASTGGTLDLIPSSFYAGSNLPIYSNSYPASNAYKASGLTDNYTMFAPTSASTTTGYCYYGFNVDIPEGATISSISCSANIRAENSTGLSIGRIMLCAGETVKGTAVDFHDSTSYNARALNSGNTWTRDEAVNIRLKIEGQRSSNNSRRIYFYGASVRIVWSLNGVEYEINVSNTTSVTTDPTGTTYVFQGKDQEIKLNTTDISNLNVTDNGNAASLSPVYVPVETASTFIPNNYSAQSTTYTISGNNGCNSTANTSNYARLRSSYNQYYTYYFFNTSIIPSGSEIVSISCQIRGRAENGTSGTYVGYAQLMGVTDLKGTEVVISAQTTGGVVISLTSGANWTTEDARNIKLRLRHPSGANNRYVSFYGASLTINYMVPGTGGTVMYYAYTISNISADHTIVISEASSDKMYTKVNGNWVQLQKVHKKINGSWVEQTDLTNVFESDKIYVRN